MKKIKINDRVELSEKATETRNALAEIIDGILVERQKQILDPDDRMYRRHWSEERQATKQQKFDDEVADWSLFFSHIDEGYLMSKRQQEAAFDPAYATHEGSMIVLRWLQSTMWNRIEDMALAENEFKAEEEADDAATITTENMSVWDAISAIADLMHEDGLTVVEIKAAADTMRRIKSDLYEVERFDAMSNRSKVAGDIAWILDKVSMVVEDRYGASDMSEELEDDIRADIEWTIEELWTGCGIERIDSEHKNFDPVVEYEMTSHDDDDAMSDRPFSIDELLAFLGDYVSDYDVTSIIEESTYCDPLTGDRFWTVGALDSEEFQRIVDRHEKTMLEDTLETITSEVGAAFRALRDQLDSDIDDTDDDDWKMSDRMSPTLAECEEETHDNRGVRIIPLSLSDETREKYRPYHEAAVKFREGYDAAMQKLHDEFTQDLPDLFFSLDPDNPADRDDYERILRETYEDLSHNDDDDDDDDGRVDEWTEWIVLAGEQEELRFDSAGDSWRWCPDMEVGRAWHGVHTTSEKVPWSGPFLYRDDALQFFNSYDPFLGWIENRKREVAEDLPLELDRRFEVCLVCQTIRRSEDGLEIIRDDSESLSKSFDITSDEKAKRLLRHVLGKS